MNGKIPRRCYLNKQVPAETAITSAIDLVESLGADIRLTRATTLLSEALNAVSDFIDDTNLEKYELNSIEHRLAALEQHTDAYITIDEHAASIASEIKPMKKEILNIIIEALRTAPAFAVAQGRNLPYGATIQKIISEIEKKL